MMQILMDMVTFATVQDVHSPVATSTLMIAMMGVRVSTSERLKVVMVWIMTMMIKR